MTLAEVLEGARAPEALKDYLRRYSWQGIHRVHADKVALFQRRAVSPALVKMIRGRQLTLGKKIDAGVGVF